MKKSIAILFALALALNVFAACGEKPAEGTTAALTQSQASTEAVTVNATEIPDASSEPDEPSLPTDPSETDPSEPSEASDPGGTSLPSDSSGTTAGSNPATTVTAPATKPAIDTKAKAIQLYADTVNKTLAANRDISKDCKTSISRPLEGDADIQKLLKLAIGGFGVEKVVREDLFGEGDAVYDQPAKEGLQPSYLTEADVTAFKATPLANGNIELTLTIKNCTNPNKPWLKQGSSPIGNFTWDFTNLQSIEEGIQSAQKTVPGLKISIAKKSVEYSNIQIKAVIKPDGSFASLVHSFSFTAHAEDIEVKELVFKVGGGSYVKGNAKSTITYTFK